MRCGSCAAMSLTCVTVGSLDEPRCKRPVRKRHRAAADHADGHDRGAGRLARRASAAPVGTHEFRSSVTRARNGTPAYCPQRCQRGPACFLLTAYPTALQAEGVDTCNAILSDALLTKRVGTNDRSYQAAEHYWACSANSSEIQRHFQVSKTRQTGASEGGGYAGVTIQGSHSTLVADHSNTDEIEPGSG